MRKIVPYAVIAAAAVIFSFMIIMLIVSRHSTEKNENVDAVTDVNGSMGAEYTDEKIADAVEYEKKRFIARTADILCGDGGYLCKVALAGVIINRVSLPGYPDDAVSVVFSDRQMSVIKHADLSIEPTDEAMQAVNDAYMGLSPCSDAVLFFGSDGISGDYSKVKILYKSGRYVFAV